MTEIKQTNPSVAAETPAVPSPARKRIPMSTPRQKLSVPPMDGWHLYWPLESRVPQFLQAGYEFVSSDEVTLNNLNPSDDSQRSGNADLSTRIRVVAGRGESGETEYHVLMKIRQEWYDEDRRQLEDRNAQILSSIFRNESILGSENVRPEDKSQRYVNPELSSFQPGVGRAPSSKPLFQRPTRKAR